MLVAIGGIVMKLAKMKKEDLELLSHKDISYYILEEEGKMNTADLFRRVVNLLELPEKTYEERIGDYYTLLTTDKRFIMLEDGNWDLRSRHTSDKIVKVTEEDEDEEDEEEIKEDTILPDEIEEDNYDSGDTDEDDDFVDADEDLKDLVVVDEEDLEEN